MAEGRYWVNAFTASGVELLLTATGGGDAVHLTRKVTAPDVGRGAVFDFCFEDGEGSNILDYDRAALLEPCWAEKTLCGREWAMMVGGDGGPVDRYDTVAFAPTCRRCLALMDRLFPVPAVDPRLPLVARVVADIVREHGYAEVYQVPGDQLAALRTAIRANVKADTGHRIQTTLVDNLLYVLCDAIYEQHAAEYSRAASEALYAFLSRTHDEPTTQRHACQVSWDSWSDA